MSGLQVRPLMTRSVLDARAHLDLAVQGAVHRAAIGELDQALALLGVRIPAGSGIRRSDQGAQLVGEILELELEVLEPLGTDLEERGALFG